MRPSIALLVTTLVVSGIAWGQNPQETGPAPGAGTSPGAARLNPGAATPPGAVGQPEPNEPGKPAATDAESKEGRVFRSGQVIPGQILDEKAAANLQLPSGPVEPYLLTKDAGPFMVHAQTFRGPDSARFALALVLELRREHRIPAYIFYKKIMPGGSNVNNVPPTAPSNVRVGEIEGAARYRQYDEAAVLVGHCKTVDEAEDLLKSIKKIHPKCLADMPSLSVFKRNSLNRAMICTNPYVPSQHLFTRKPDPLIKRLNSGPRSILNCPGPFTLQVAEFRGRSTFMVDDPKFLKADLATSPLATAADDAVKLAEEIAKDEEVRKAGYPVYVYHDREASRVTIGSFRTQVDPSANPAKNAVMKMAVNLSQKKITDNPIVFVPVLLPVPNQ